MKRFAIVAAALAVWTITTTHAESRGRGIPQSVDMQSTGLESGAHGRALLMMVNPYRGRFEIRATLTAETAYEVVVDGVHVGDLTTDDNGHGNARFRTKPRKNKPDGYLGFDPRGKVAVVRNATGQDVLAGELPGNKPHGGKPHDAGKIACCTPDDDGTQCEDRAADECLAAGGTVSAANSCLPDPCDGHGRPPKKHDVVCCLPDDSGPECEDRDASACAVQGGIVVSAESCATNPCVPIPAADGDIRCCLPDDSGSECEDRTPAECLGAGGLDIGAGVCAPHACDGVEVTSTSIEDNTTSTSVEDNTTSTSVEGNTTSTSVEGNTTSTSVEDNTTSTSIEDNTTSTTVEAYSAPPSLVVSCKNRVGRSQVSVNGKDLAVGFYTASISSGANAAVAGAMSAVLGEVEFDFDSNTELGATTIPAEFIQGLEVAAQLADASGHVVLEASVSCVSK